MSTEHITQLKTVLAANNYHVTKAREATFRLLISPEPQTMSEILLKAKGTVDRVSVYRNIELFEQLGIAHRIYVGWKYKLELSDQFMAHHHHMSCLLCGKVIDIDDEKHIDDFIGEITRRYGFKPRRHQFEIDGYCMKCQSSKSATPLV
jgi:Fur family ferric uptake transcriptional regulator